MKSDNYSTEQHQEQQHAEAAELLQDASYYVLLSIDSKDNIKILHGCPGEISWHDEHCALSMLKGFAKFHVKELECRSYSSSDEAE